MKVILVVQVAKGFQYSSPFNEEPGEAACSPSCPLVQLYVAVGYSCRISGDEFASLLFLPWTLE